MKLRIWFRWNQPYHENMAAIPTGKVWALAIPLPWRKEGVIPKFGRDYIGFIYYKKQSDK